jgi:hypothetical protein
VVYGIGAWYILIELAVNLLLFYKFNVLQVTVFEYEVINTFAIITHIPFKPVHALTAYGFFTLQQMAKLVVQIDHMIIFYVSKQYHRKLIV